jgi:hypothetical protein
MLFSIFILKEINFFRNEDAERDCTSVLKLQAKNVKALFRRAQARVVLGKLQDARAGPPQFHMTSAGAQSYILITSTDLVAAAKAEPGNAAVRTEFTKVEGLISEAAKKVRIFHTFCVERLNDGV